MERKSAWQRIKSDCEGCFHRSLSRSFYGKATSRVLSIIPNYLSNEAKKNSRKGRKLLLERTENGYKTWQYFLRKILLLGVFCKKRKNVQSGFTTACHTRRADWVFRKDLKEYEVQKSHFL